MSVRPGLDPASVRSVAWDRRRDLLYHQRVALAVVARFGTVVDACNYIRTRAVGALSVARRHQSVQYVEEIKRNCRDSKCFHFDSTRCSVEKF